jgi:hypothetical protein
MTRIVAVAAATDAEARGGSSIGLSSWWETSIYTAPSSSIVSAAAAAAVAMNIYEYYDYG